MLTKQETENYLQLILSQLDEANIKYNVTDSTDYKNRSIKLIDLTNKLDSVRDEIELILDPADATLGNQDVIDEFQVATDSVDEGVAKQIFKLLIKDSAINYNYDDDYIFINVTDLNSEENLAIRLVKEIVAIYDYIKIRRIVTSNDKD